MSRTLLLRIALLPLLAWSSAQAAAGWSELKVGMTQRETVSVLGPALLTSSGRGFDVAIYDDGAEVVYHAGRTVSWTAPAAARVSSQVGTWKFGPAVGERSASTTRRHPPTVVAAKPNTKRTLPEYRH